MSYRVACVLFLSLTACGGGPLSLLTGSGPNVAANVQAGKNNAQTVGTTNITEQRLVRPQARSIEQSTGATRVRAQEVESVTVVEASDTPVWYWVALIVAVLVDSPRHWPRQIWQAVKKMFGRK